MPGHLQHALATDEGFLGTNAGDTLFRVDASERLFFGCEDTTQASMSVTESGVQIPQQLAVGFPSEQDPSTLAHTLDVSGSVHVTHLVQTNQLQVGANQGFDEEATVHILGEDTKTSMVIGSTHQGIRVISEVDPKEGTTANRLFFPQGEHEGTSWMANTKNAPVSTRGKYVMSPANLGAEMDLTQIFQTLPDTQGSDVRVAGFASGEYLVVWLDPSGELQGQRLSAHGVLIDNVFRVSLDTVAGLPTAGTGTLLGDVTVTTDQGYIVTWARNGTVWIQNQELGGPLPITSSLHAAGDLQTNVQHVSLEDNRVGVLYENWVGGDFNTRQQMVTPLNVVLEALDVHDAPILNRAWYGQALHMDTYAYTTIASPPVHTALTIQLWIRAQTLDANRRTLIAIGDISSHRMVFVEQGVVGVTLDNYQSTVMASTTPLTPNTWTHVVVTMTTASGSGASVPIQIYLDSVLCASGPLDYTWFGSTNVRLGAAIADTVSGDVYNPSTIWGGDMQDVRIWTAVLGANDVERIYNLRAPYPLAAVTAATTPYASSLWSAYSMEVRDGILPGTYPLTLQSTSSLFTRGESSVETVGTGTNPATAILQNGNQVILWMNQDADTDIFAQLLAPDGTIVLPTFLVNQTRVENQRNPRVVALTTGRFVVAWESFLQDLDRWGIYACVFSNGGKVLVPEFRVNQHTLDEQSHLSIAACGTETVIAWEHYSSGLVKVRWQMFDAFMNPKFSNEQPVASLQTVRETHPIVTAGGVQTQGFTVAFYADNGGDTSLFVRHFTQAGIPSGPEVSVGGVIVPDENVAPQLITLENEHYVVLWKGKENQAYEYQILGRILTPTGSTWIDDLYSFHTAVYRSSTEQRVSEIVAMADPIGTGTGGYMVAWAFENASVPSAEIYLLHADASGHVDTSAIRVSPNLPAEVYQHPALGGIEEICVVWETVTGIATGEIQQVRIPLVGTQVVHDTVYQETIRSTNHASLRFQAKEAYAYTPTWAPSHTSDLTISLWCKTLETPTVEPCTLWSLGGGDGLRSLAVTSNSLLFTVGNAINYVALASPQEQLHDGHWHCLTTVMRPVDKVAVLFLDGVAVPGGYFTQFSPFLLGWGDRNTLLVGAAPFGTGDVTATYSGLLDEMLLWDTTLSTLEIGVMYNGGAPKVEPVAEENLLAWWSFSGVVNNQYIQDRSTANHTLTLAKFPTTIQATVNPQEVFDASHVARCCIAGNTDILATWIPTDETEWKWNLSTTQTATPKTSGARVAWLQAVPYTDQAFAVAWMEEHGGTWDLYVTRIAADGTRLANDLTVVEGLPTEPTHVHIVDVPSTGFYIGWDAMARVVDPQWNFIGPVLSLYDVEMDVRHVGPLSESGVALVGIEGGQITQAPFTINAYLQEHLIYPNTFNVLTHTEEMGVPVWTIHPQTRSMGIGVPEPTTALEIRGTVRVHGNIEIVDEDGQETQVSGGGGAPTGFPVTSEEERGKIFVIDASGNSSALVQPWNADVATQFITVFGGEASTDFTSSIAGAVKWSESHNWYLPEARSWKLYDFGDMLYPSETGDSFDFSSATLVTQGRDHEKVSVPFVYRNTQGEYYTLGKYAMLTPPTEVLRPGYELAVIYNVQQVNPSSQAFFQTFVLAHQEYYDGHYDKKYGYAVEEEFVRLPSKQMHLEGTTLYVLEYLRNHGNTPLYSVDAASRALYYRLIPTQQSERVSMAWVWNGTSYVLSASQDLYPVITSRQYGYEIGAEQAKFYEPVYTADMGWGDPTPNATVLVSHYAPTPAVGGTVTVSMNPKTQKDWLYQLYVQTYLYIRYGSVFAAPEESDTEWNANEVYPLQSRYATSRYASAIEVLSTPVPGNTGLVTDVRVRFKASAFSYLAV